MNIDSKHAFTDVICNHKKDNGHLCNTQLGLVESTRANIAIHFCRICKVSYISESDGEGGVITTMTKTRVTPTSLKSFRILNTTK